MPKAQRRLTPRQERFVQEYLIDLNASQAALRAGYSSACLGRRLVAKSNVSEAIELAQRDRRVRVKLTQDRVLQELETISFSDVTKYAAVEDGKVVIKPTSSMTDGQKHAIASIEQGPHGIKLKLHDKIPALQLLARHLGMIDRNGAPEDDVVRIVDDF